jgi:alpha-D-xyloside xylohydrolase
VEYAEHIYSVTTGEESIDLLCPTKHIQSRGDTLNCPTVSIRLEAEAENVISVEVTHWAGALRKKPDFELFPHGKQDFVANVVQHDGGTTLTAGNLSATVGIDGHDFSIQFHSADSSKTLTSMLNRSVGFAYSPTPGNMKGVGDMRDINHYIFTQTELGVGESIHGLGERFGAFNKVGQHVEIWNEDGYGDSVPPEF